jgi:hypothetical protein
VAINGRPYLVDIRDNQFTRQFDARVRDSVDQSTEPGEGALNPQGLWRRSQSSWHYGAGQQYSDTADAEAYRFYTSKGVDVWTKGRLSLLPDTTRVLTSANTNHVHGDRRFAGVCDGRADVEVFNGFVNLFFGDWYCGIEPVRHCFGWLQRVLFVCER